MIDWQHEKLSVAALVVALLVCADAHGAPVEITFGGDLTFGSSASLEIEIAGTSIGPPTEYDRLLIAGTATLGGTLDVSLFLGFTPSVGNLFEIITASNVVDTFAVENLPDLGGLIWNVNYSATNVVLEVATPFTADFDLDGDVDGDDLTDPVDGWEARFGVDLNGSNFLDWQRQFGSGVSPLAASRAVPEPTTGLLVATLLAIGWPRFSRRLKK